MTLIVTCLSLSVSLWTNWLQIEFWNILIVGGIIGVTIISSVIITKKIFPEKPSYDEEYRE